MAQHSRWTRARVSNNTALVVHCEGPLEPARLRRALDRFLDACPWPAARLQRPFPWGKLRWTAGPRAALVTPSIHHRAARADEDCHRILEAELNDAIDPRRDAPVRFTVIDVGPEPATARGVLVVTWFHPLMDPRGSQNLLTRLAALDTDDGQSPWQEGSPTVAVPAARRPLRERGRVARRSLEYMRTLAPVPPVSPGTQITEPGPVRFRRASFVERDAHAHPARSTREISWRLAVVGKAMTELMRRRGVPDVPFLLPIAVDLRSKGEAGPTFGNLLAFHFARFRPSDTADLPALARALRQQMADAVRDGQIDANAVAMEFLQYRPLSMMLRALPWTASGDIFSFNCADLSDFPPALDRFLGRRVVNGYHVPCVLPRPGIGVFFNRCAGVNNVVVSWVEGAVGEDEAARVVGTVGEEMGWIATS
jgi:hypothetical protein